MQNAADLGDILSMGGTRMYAICNLTVYVFLTYVRDIATKFVTYWYQFFSV